MSFPKNLFFHSDSTHLELQKEVKENKVDYGIYRYVSAKVFLGMELKLTKERIEEMLKKEIIVTNDRS